MLSDSVLLEGLLTILWLSNMGIKANFPANMIRLRRVFSWCILPLILLTSLTALSQMGSNSSQVRVLKSVQEITSMKNAEAGNGYPVAIAGTVTYSDPEWGLLFVKDTTGSTYINVHGTSTRYALGTRVRVDGTTASGDVAPIVTHAKIRVLGSDPAPAPEPITLANLDTGIADSHWVSTEGVLHPCHESWTRVCFRIFDGKTVGWVIVPETDSPAAQRLMGAAVHVKGVCGVHLDKAHKRIGVQLFVNSLSDILPEGPVLSDPFSSLFIPIGSVTSAYINQRFVLPVHLRGVVTWASPRGLFVQDSTGAAFAETEKPVAVRTGSSVDLEGFPSRSEFGLTISDPAVRLIASSANAAEISPLNLSAAEILKRSLNGRQVHLKARLISQTANDTGVVYQLEDGDQRFTASLLQADAARQTVNLSRNSILELTGVAVVRKGTSEWPDSLMVLVTSPADIVVSGGYGWLTLPARAHHDWIGDHHAGRSASLGEYAAADGAQANRHHPRSAGKRVATGDQAPAAL